MKIALTGGIGSGKTSVGCLLATVLKVETVDADIICKDLLLPNNSGWIGLEKHFGPRFFTNDGSINRPLLREVLFADQNVRETVEKILHPLVRKEINNNIAQLLLAEIPLLFEAGWYNDFDWIVTVFALPCVAAKRVVARDQVNLEEARLSIAAQIPPFEKAVMADSVVENSGAWSQTCLQIYHLAKVLQIKNKEMLDTRRMKT